MQRTERFDIKQEGRVEDKESPDSTFFWITFFDGSRKICTYLSLDILGMYPLQALQTSSSHGWNGKKEGIKLEKQQKQVDSHVT